MPSAYHAKHVLDPQREVLLTPLYYLDTWVNTDTYLDMETFLGTFNFRHELWRCATFHE